jgi:hypothetical protein
MARHDDYLKYGLWAIGGYLAYTKLWPTLSSTLSNLGTSIATSVSNFVPGSNIPVSSIATVMHPSGLASSTYFGINLPASVSSGTTSQADLSTIAGYYITPQDSANISLMAGSSNSGYNFSDWSKYYRQAKGISLMLSNDDVGIPYDQVLTLSQFTVLVNSHYPKPAGLAGIYGLQVFNGYGVF